MGLVSPWFLGGLLAVGLPIYFHLLRQHKSTPLKFSSLMFFERTTQSSIKHRRLRYLALMAVRIALLVLLALAFTGPYIMRTILPGAAGDRLLVLVVDNSFSMREGGRLEAAKQQAVDVASGIGEGNEAQVATIGAHLTFLTQPSPERAELTAAIRTIEPGDSRSSFGELARALRAMTETVREPLEVHLFSDMQRSSLPSGFADLQLPATAALVLHPVAEDGAPNFAVEAVSAPSSLFDPEKVRVQATISGYNADAAQRTVSLVANGDVVDTKTAEVPENGRATVEFLSLNLPYGFNRCEVRIETSDRLREDDKYLFAIERADPR
ncbi:MAG: VWA domain-containing protein, partial [bacterium]|nr:VWA domain-containing protein [bacterium]